MRRAGASLLLSASAHAEGRPLYGGSAQVALPGAPARIDPLSPLLSDEELALLVFDTPFRLDESGTPRPALALALEQTATRARLKLRSEVRFHDGTPVKASDLAASLERALADPAGWTLAPIRAVHAVGDDLVELELTRAAPDLPLLLATPAAAVSPAGSRRAVGTGPFAVESMSAGDAPQVRLVANANDFAGRPYLDAITLRTYSSRVDEAQSFEAGALDLARHGSSGARRPQLVVDGPQSIVGYLALGRALTDERAAQLGQLLDGAIDRERLRRLVREPARTLPPRHPVAPSARSPAPLALTLLVDRSRPDQRPLAERILIELGKVGVNVTIDATDARSYAEHLVARDYQLALGELAPPVETLAELALLAVVDPAAARQALARAPASPSLPELERARILALYRRAGRVVVPPELKGVRVDASGRPSLEDAWKR